LKTDVAVMTSKAIAYLRTSSANLGEDKDSQPRQRAAIKAFAKRAGYEVVGEFADEGVSGADPVDQRPGLTAALAYIAGNGARTIIVENASRFARDLITQQTGWRFLRELGIDLIAADSPGSFLDDTPTAVLIRQVLGAVSQFEKAALVAKLRGARQRKRVAGVKVEGRKSVAEARPEAVALAKRLARYHRKGHKLSLRDIAAELEAAGHVTKLKTRYGAAAVARMIAG
jgi:DNA invertase Pin-like site-specific DNA recombinase